MTRIILNPQTAYYTAAGHLNTELGYKAGVLTGMNIEGLRKKY